MSDKNKKSCCSDSSCCPTSNEAQKKRNIVIDFLYLDLDTCSVCQETENNLDDALKEVKGILEATGVEVTLNKINVATEEQAIKFRFLSSPTIRVNGNDIQLEVKEKYCKSCSDLSGETVDCRVWTYQGKEYSTPPKGMIINAILEAVYGNSTVVSKDDNYKLPENLKKFYAAMRNKND